MMTHQSNRTTEPYGMVMCPLREVHIATLDTPVPYLVNAGLSVPLSIVTSFANLVVLFAMRRVTSIRLPSKLLLCSLVLTDLGFGLVVQPQFIAFLLVRGTRPYLGLCSLHLSWIFSESIFATGSLLSLAAISLDRYAALFFHLKYQQIVTTRRVCVVLTFIWSWSLVCASTSLLNYFVWLCFLMFSIIFCFPVMSVVCIKIYRRLRAPQLQPQTTDQSQQQAGNTLSKGRYRRTESAMMLVYLLFLICYVPFVCTAIVEAFRSTALHRCILEFASTFVLLNSCLNPFAYCLRLPEIRTEVKKHLHKLISCQTSE